MKTRKTLALLLALVMTISTAAFAFAAGTPAAKGLYCWNAEDGACDGEFDLMWTALDDMERMSVFGSRVMVSADQSNWLVAWSTTDRSKHSAAITEFEQGGKPVPGTTYYFYAQFIGKNGDFGEKSNVISLKFSDKTNAVLGDWDALKAGLDNFRVTESSSNYDKVHLKAGTAVTFDTTLYTLTVKIAAVKGGVATVQTEIKQKIGDESLFYAMYLYTDYRGNRVGESLSEKNGTTSTAIKLADLQDGANHFTVSVHYHGGAQFNGLPGYRDYASSLNYFEEKHTVSFQNAPKAGALDRNAVAATKNAVALGKAYKSASKTAVGSGTIVYYKASGAKKWSSKAFAAGKNMTVKGLKAATAYQFKTVNFVKAISAADGETVITSKSGYSKAIPVTTAIASAPEIASIKVSGAKRDKIHMNGYWESDGDWHPAYDIAVTNYKLTITLKSAPKGMQGIKVTGADRNGYPVWVKGTGKTFTVNASAKGNIIGKSVKLGICTYTNNFGPDSGHTGNSAVAKKAVTVR